MSRAWEQFRDADGGLPVHGASSRATGVGRAFGARGFLAQRREDIATCPAETPAAVTSAAETLGAIVPFEVVSLPIVEGDAILVVVTLARARAGAPWRHADIALSADVCILAAERLIAIRREARDDTPACSASRRSANEPRANASMR